MNADLIWIGILRGSYFVPVALAFALVVRHGRYLPLWLPECGMIAAYLEYAMITKAALPPQLAVYIAIAAGTGIALLIHYSLFAVYALRPEPLKALLRSIGVLVVLENLVSLLSGGYSLAFPSPLADGLSSVGKTGQQDRIIFWAFAWPRDRIIIWVFVLTVMTWLFVNRTWAGLAYRAISSNRTLARRYGLPTRLIDLLVFVIGGTLCSLGGIFSGHHYGLTADMMMPNAMKVAAVVVAVGAERLGLISVGMLLIGVVESLCQASPRFSAFEDGVPYAVLAIALLLRYGLEPLLRHVHAAAPSTTEQKSEAPQ